jgi:hypothetical protein
MSEVTSDTAMIRGALASLIISEVPILSRDLAAYMYGKKHSHFSSARGAYALTSPFIRTYRGCELGGPFTTVYEHYEDMFGTNRKFLADSLTLLRAWSYLSKVYAKKSMLFRDAPSAVKMGILNCSHFDHTKILSALYFEDLKYRFTKLLATRTFLSCEEMRNLVQKVGFTLVDNLVQSGVIRSDEKHQYRRGIIFKTFFLYWLEDGKLEDNTRAFEKYLTKFT